MRKQQEISRKSLRYWKMPERKEIHEKVESKALWETIKAFRKKFSKAKVIPEEYQIPEHVTPLKRCKPDISTGLTEEQVQERISLRGRKRSCGISLQIYERDCVQQCIYLF